MAKIKGLLKLKLFFLSYFFICQFENVMAAGEEGIDVFHKDDNVRIIRYDMKDQKIKEVYNFTSNSSAQLQQEIDKIDVPLLKINHEGDITFEQGFNAQKYTVRTSGDIDNSELDASGEQNYELVNINNFNNIYDKRYKTLSRAKEIKSGQHILECLISQEKKIANEASLSVTSYPLQPNVVRTLENSANSFLCAVGEAVTELTMLSFGYNQLHSKYEDNHGLDGVFIDDSDNPECFITESKCWAATQTASTTMKKLLSEGEIRRKIQTGLKKDGSIKASMQHLESFIFDNENSVFKYAHRTTLSGSTQRALKPLDYTEYMRLSGRMTIGALVDQLEKLSTTERNSLRELLPNFFTAI